jgi:hypothetical protein
MPNYGFDIETWNKIKRTEFLRGGVNGWEVDFTEALKKIKEQEKYDKIWELIKRKIIGSNYGNRFR